MKRILTNEKIIGKIIFPRFTPEINKNSMIDAKIKESHSVIMFKEHRMQANKELPLVK